MIALAGRLLVLAALLSSAAGALLGFASGSLPGGAGRRWTRRLALFFAAAMVLANLLMEYALLRHDFSVGYVAQVGSRAVPVWVTVVSLWSSLEGSILFWGLVMAVYVLVATFGPGRAPTPYAVAVWLACGAFFSFLIAGPAQPFATVAVKALDGPGPNPLLQNHVLMAIHPPFLYAGYVGMTIPFGLACAALLEGKAAREFIGPLRNFLLLPWIFLTVAIVLGGWWAYEVLGWGGYWAWDPVENASLLPWLTATAALHSALLVERKGVLKGWTLTLVMATWLLTILGTFMTRSGVFNSVHSFTQSAIGPTLLVFLAAALLFSVLLLTLRIDLLAAEGQLERGASRDVALLVQNLLFVLFTFTVLLGTVFPLVVEAVRGAQISVGRPYFDRMTVPIGVALIFVMGLGPALPWGRATREEARAALLFPLAGGAALLLVAFALGLRNAWALVTLFFGGYTAQVTLAQMLRPVRQRMLAHGEGLLQALASSGGRGRRRTGAYLAHAGVLLVMLAIAVSSTMGQSMEVQLHAGESASLGSYTITFAGGERVDEPHRRSQVAQIDVTRNGRSAGSLYPRMNLYETQREPIGTPAVRSSLTEDLYISIHNIDPATRTVGLLVLVNPMVPWIWIATAVTAIGGILSLWPSWRARPVTAPAAALEGSSG